MAGISEALGSLFFSWIPWPTCIEAGDRIGGHITWNLIYSEPAVDARITHS